MQENGPPFNACAVAKRLGVSLSTLNWWISADEERRPEYRRFQFHSYRGRKRIWSETHYLSLERAVEIESAPGGVLGGWRKTTDRENASERESSAREALDRVLNFRQSNDPEDETGGGEDQGPPPGAP
jgi:hypothetical protein